MMHEICWKRKTINQEFCVRQNSPFEKVREIKAIWDKQNFKISITNKMPLQEILKGVL